MLAELLLRLDLRLAGRLGLGLRLGLRVGLRVRLRVRLRTRVRGRLHERQGDRVRGHLGTLGVTTSPSTHKPFIAPDNPNMIKSRRLPGAVRRSSLSIVLITKIRIRHNEVN